MSQRLSYTDLDALISALFSQISEKFNPDIIIHPGIRTDFLVKKAREYFQMEPFIIDNARDFPFKRVLRLVFYDLFDMVPDVVSKHIVDWYIKVVHSENKSPKVLDGALDDIPNGTQSALILDDVYCTGQTCDAISKELRDRGVLDIRTATLVYTPVNDSRPDFYAQEGRYSLPWRQIGV